MIQESTLRNSVKTSTERKGSYKNADLFLEDLCTTNMIQTFYFWNNNCLLLFFYFIKSIKKLRMTSIVQSVGSSASLNIAVLDNHHISLLPNSSLITQLFSSGFLWNLDILDLDILENADILNGEE
jgi:hypothetical protein